MSAVQTAHLIGKPFRYGGRGPDAYDCYGLLMELYAQKGIALPDYLSPSDGARISALITCELRLWKPTTLREGVMLHLHVPGNSHVGYYLGNDYFIHAWESSGGVTKERLGQWSRRVMGIYEYVGNPHV